MVGDLHRTTSKRPEVTVDGDQPTVRITVDGSYVTPSMWAHPFERARAFAEVADYVQDQLLPMSDADAVWPCCPAHGYGLLARVREGSACWWCDFGNHAVAVVGELRPTSDASGNT